MLSLIPSILFSLQLVILYFDRDLFGVSLDNIFFVISIICTNFLVILITSVIFSRSNKKQDQRLNLILGNHISNKIFYIYIFSFFIQVFINKSIPFLENIFNGPQNSYSNWGLVPFSGIMTITFFLILIERTSNWLELNTVRQNNKNNLYIFIMVFISILMLRRDIFALLLSSSFIIFINFLSKSFTGLYKNNILKKSDLSIFSKIIILFILFIIIFTLVGNIRGQGTGLSRDYWKVFFVYISSPLANSINIINHGDSSFLGFADFLLSRSNTGQTLMKLLDIEVGTIPKSIFAFPQFNIFSSLGFYYQTFGEQFYLYMVFLSSGILALIEIYWKTKYPILFSAILILASSSIFTHYFGSVTFTIVFPFIYFLQRLNIRLK